jgi:hypothetical protein
MYKFLSILIAITFLTPSLAHAASWQDRSSEIPTTYLDKYVSIPYISFSKSRGNDWLAGNQNQLFHVLPDRIIDLTPDLKKFGFGNIRQISTDGNVWLILGDAHIWQSKPDIAMIYDGKYFKNVSTFLKTIPRDEWINQITGKQGLWYIVTDKNIYSWHSALSAPSKITTPSSFKEPRVSAITIHPVTHGWILNFEQKNGPKSISQGRNITDRRFFFFDGQNFQELTSLFSNMSNFSTIGSNGSNILAIGSVINNDSTIFKAFLSDGINITDVSSNLKTILPANIPSYSQLFLNIGNIAWSGSAWVFTNDTKNLAIWYQNQQPKLLANTYDNIIDVGYGKSGTILMSGYNTNVANIFPRLIMLQP